MWNEKGAKQVLTVGQEEKHAFTLVPSISASGVLLPMQAVFHGQTLQFCPSAKAPRYDEAKKLGYHCVPSKTATYWSNLQTMQRLVKDIIKPYFDKTKEELSLPESQCSIWKIDCWSVHRSDEFVTWMKDFNPTIIIIFIPGGCTGLWQPLDVGIQRVMKLSIKRSAHRDIVREVLKQLEAEMGHDIHIDTRLGILRDMSVGWIVDTIKEIDKPELILKVSVPYICYISMLINTYTRLSNFAKSEISIVCKRASPLLKHLQLSGT